MQIFISHSTKDDAQIDRLADLLAARGITAWVDHRGGIPPGSPNWDKALRDAIHASDAGLFVMSGHSLNSEMCGSECLRVRELGKPLYIARLEAVDTADIWLYIKQIQYADLVTDFEAGVHKLIAVLRGTSTDGDAPQPIRGKFTGREVLQRHLPYALTNPMRGRDDDLARLKAMLNGGVVQIIGTGGTGKSRLAAEAAFQHPAGVIWHRCAPTSQVTDALVQVAQHLDMPLTTPRDVILAQLAQRPALVVIDNAEDVPADDLRRAEYVRLLADLCACGAPVMLTARAVWAELKPRKDLTPTAIDLATAALIARDFADADGTLLNDADAATLAQAARLYPRLIEFAVGQLKDREFERVVKALTELKSRDVREALDEMVLKTVRQMAAQERDGASAESLLRQLTVCAADFDRATLTALAPPPLDEDEDALDDAIAVLRRWRFLRYDDGQRRYTVEDIARAALPADDAAFLRYAAYFTTQAEQFYKLPPQDWRDTIERDVLHILAVGDGLVERMNPSPLTLSDAQSQGAPQGERGSLQELALEFAINTKNFVFRRMEYQRRAWLEMGLALSRAAGNQNRDSLFLNQLGLLWDALGEKHKALDYYEQALPIFRVVGDRAGEATTLNNIGLVWDDFGEKHKALAYYEQARPIFRAVGDRAGEATMLNNIGMVWSALGEKQKARAYYEQALPIYRAVGDRAGEATTLNNIGGVWDDLGENQKALAYYEQALPIFRAVGDRAGEATTLNNIGMVWDDLGEKQKALAYYEEALPIRRAVGDRAGEAVTCFNIGMVYESLGDLDQAIAYIERCVALDIAVSHPDLESDRRTLTRLKAKHDSLTG